VYADPVDDTVTPDTGTGTPSDVSDRDPADTFVTNCENVITADVKAAFRTDGDASENVAVGAFAWIVTTAPDDADGTMLVGGWRVAANTTLPSGISTEPFVVTVVVVPVAVADPTRIPLA
jgi:hypothetical protein